MKFPQGRKGWKLVLKFPLKRKHICLLVISIKGCFLFNDIKINPTASYFLSLWLCFLYVCGLVLHYWHLSLTCSQNSSSVQIRSWCNWVDNSWLLKPMLCHIVMIIVSLQRCIVTRIYCNTQTTALKGHFLCHTASNNCWILNFPIYFLSP